MQSQIERANEENMKILIGGDMNGHIWELDKCEKANGRLIKDFARECGLQIGNCIWDTMNGATWFINEKEYVLDYISW